MSPWYLWTLCSFCNVLVTFHLSCACFVALALTPPNPQPPTPDPSGLQDILAPAQDPVCLWIFSLTRLFHFWSFLKSYFLHFNFFFFFVALCLTFSWVYFISFLYVFKAVDCVASSVSCHFWHSSFTIISNYFLMIVHLPISKDNFVWFLLDLWINF